MTNGTATAQSMQVMRGKGRVKSRDGVFHGSRCTCRCAIRQALQICQQCLGARPHLPMSKQRQFGGGTLCNPGFREVLFHLHLQRQHAKPQTSPVAKSHTDELYRFLMSRPPCSCSTTVFRSLPIPITPSSSSNRICTRPQSPRVVRRSCQAGHEVRKGA